LALTVSADTQNALVTLKSIDLVKKMGISTSLGVSNISFGLPCREKINSTFFAAALERGLDCAIMNPFSKGMMDVYYSFRVLHNMDTACASFIEYANNEEKDAVTETQSQANAVDLKYAVEKGMKKLAVDIAKQMLCNCDGIDIINNQIIPALNKVGQAFENKKAYLPQLLMSAEAATAAFDVIKEKLPQSEINKDEAVVLATVKGDIHDIGKNIVKVLLESYGFLVYDLGRDVAPETVLEFTKEKKCKLVGLSALMTTTVPAMEETIKILHNNLNDVLVMVGGAVLNEEYARNIKADYYAKDAMQSVNIAKRFYNR